MQILAEVDKEKVRIYADKILASSVFSGSPRQQRFLDYLITHTLNGDADRLKGYTIGIEVFDKKYDFDPSIDAIVRVEATRIRNKLREYYESLGKTDEIRINFRKGNYQLDFSFHPIGDNSQGAGILANASNNVEIYQPDLITDKPSLVVLPFVSISADDSRDYFADGLTDNLISMLSRISGLFVISRQSSFAYKGTRKTSKEIAAELGVQYLLEGSVQHAGDRVRIAVHLIKASDSRHLWSERYDRELQDIFGLQDELTQQIANALQVRLTSEEDKIFGYQATNSIDAHDTLLRATVMYLNYSHHTVEEAVALFTKTIALDPDYAAAHAWLARALAFQWAMFWVKDPSILEVALKHAQRAVELAPHSSYAISMLGWVLLWCKDAEASIAYSKQAIALDPNNAEALLFLSLCLSSAGLGEEGLIYIKKAKRLTPTPASLYEYALGNCYYVLKDYKTAISIYDYGIKLSPSFIPNYYTQMFSYARLGMYKEVKKNLDALHELTGFSKDLPAISIWTNQKVIEEESVLIEVIREKGGKV